MSELRSSQVVSLATPQAALPEPFSPPEADLRAFGFMPLEVGRLRRSKTWLIAKRRPEIGFYAMNLWMASWHELPAGSLEPDDDLLADMAMCPADRWAEVRDEVMRGWTLCSDGRLYHAVVAEKVNEAWEMRRAHSERARARIAKRWAKKKNGLAEEAKVDNQENAELPAPAEDAGGIQDVYSTYTGCITARIRQDKTRQEIEDSVSSLRSDTGETATAASPPVESKSAIPDADPMATLWGPALKLTCKLTGKREGQGRALVGLWLKEVGNDPEIVLAALREAREKRPLDLESWVMAHLRRAKAAAAVAEAPAVDYGEGWQACRSRARPWFAEMAKREERTGRWAVGGYYIDAVENRVLEAARLPRNWPGDTKPIAEWLAAGWESDAIAAVVSDMAGRANYQEPRSLRYFDKAVRAAPKQVR